MSDWNKSRIKYWLDVISDIALLWCGAVVLAILLGLDLEMFIS